MRTITAVLTVSLDGVAQAPGRQDEDTRDGFRYGGWAVPYGDAVLGESMAKSMAETDALLLGRRTYEDLYSYWPSQQGNPYSEVLTKAPKHVVSTTLQEPLPWDNSFLINADVPRAVQELKSSNGKGICLLGSVELTHYLHRWGLIDRYLLLIHPVLLGRGRRAFDTAEMTRLSLLSSKVTSTGVMIATYRTEVGQ